MARTKSHASNQAADRAILEVPWPVRKHWWIPCKHGTPRWRWRWALCSMDGWSDTLGGYWQGILWNQTGKVRVRAAWTGVQRRGAGTVWGCSLQTRRPITEESLIPKLQLASGWERVSMDEHCIGISNKVQRRRSIWRRPEAKRWDTRSTRQNDFKGTTYNATPGNTGIVHWLGTWCHASSMYALGSGALGTMRKPGRNVGGTERYRANNQLCGFTKKWPNHKMSRKQAMPKRLTRSRMVTGMLRRITAAPWFGAKAHKIQVAVILPRHIDIELNLDQCKGRVEVEIIVGVSVLLRAFRLINLEYEERLAIGGCLWATWRGGEMEQRDLDYQKEVSRCSPTTGGGAYVRSFDWYVSMKPMEWYWRMVNGATLSCRGAELIGRCSLRYFCLVALWWALFACWCFPRVFTFLGWRKTCYAFVFERKKLFWRGSTFPEAIIEP